MSSGHALGLRTEHACGSDTGTASVVLRPIEDYRRLLTSERACGSDTGTEGTKINLTTVYCMFNILCQKNVQ